MSKFYQWHIITAYPPANLNRDDLGRPKTARLGGTERMRISSQSLKRAWRMSDLFQSAMDGHVGTRTKRIGGRVYERLVKNGIGGKRAFEVAKDIASAFGKLDETNPEWREGDDRSAILRRLDIGHLVHVGPQELAATDQLAKLLVDEKRKPTQDEQDQLRQQQNAVDIALFGRMLAEHPRYNTEAACQVAHAITVHAVAIEDDFYTAVDDLNEGDEERGAGHLGETGFGAGVFYSYICLDNESLIRNLGGDETLAARARSALTETAVTVGPTGKQNSFASRARAIFAMVEIGDQQPRSLTAAFLKPIHSDYAKQAIEQLLDHRDKLDQVYGACANSRNQIDAIKGEGTLAEMLNFVSQ